MRECFKQFIQETAAKSKNALNEKDEVIKRLKEHIDTLNSEISSKVQYVNSKEDEIKKLKADHQYGFSVLVKKCSDMEEKLIKSEETRLNLDEQSKNFLRDLQVKLKQKDVMFQRTQNELNTARDTNRKLTEQLEGATQRSKKQELLAKEAGKIIQNITDEKDNTVIKLKESNELCDKMQKLLMEKDSIVTSLKKEKVSLTEQIRNLYHQSSKLQDKLELKKKKIEEFEHNMKRLKTFVVELQQKNNKAGQLNFTIRERLEWMNKANDGNEKLMKDLKLANKTSNDQKNALSRKLAYQENQIRSQEKRLKELKQSLAQRKASIVELERNVRDLKSRKEELENDTFVLKNRLQESEQSNLTLQSALNELKVKENNLLLQTQDFERCKGEEINTLKKEIEGLRFYLSQSEDIIASITKERDTLIQDLEKTVQTHKDVNQTIESYNKCLTNDKTALEIKLKDLENVLLERNNEIGDLKNVLSSAETSHCYLTEQVAELNSLKLDMEKKKEEINSLKEQLKEMERASEKEMQEGRKKMKKSEEVFTRLRDDYQKLESVLREKESELRESHNTNNKIILENEELKELLNKTCHINKQLDMTLLGYKENADRHESSLAQLKTDNEFLKEFAKDTEKAKLKLDSLEESLQKKTTELKDLNDKLLAETKQSSTLREELNKQESTCNKLKDRYETRIKTSAREVDELRTMLDEKNKEISVIKMEKNSCEMKQREAEFKVLELTNSLRDETAYEQNITQRNKELEIELRKIQYEKRLGLVSSSVDAAQILREIPQTDIATERRLQQKVDNIALDKIRNLHTKASNLEVQLEQERHDRVKEHAEVARLKAELAVYKSLQ
ncbi:putative leucine-rich repeat-containing protein DDB_G0290503 [Exaiptasia diaphana]|uniref:Uncharacterized protein n=1 Tax=Exaiptasia diaphana TaxID=2652724 RepID=A0A913Y7F8_EXADI|nr:putative leucine-rich repeat-containing protein DDB_G0290503 [Exaiptasia diaphana]